MRYPLALLTVLCLCLLGSAQARTVANPIEGRWSSVIYGKKVPMEVTITRAGSGFVGTLTKTPYPPTKCQFVGAKVWQIRSAGAGKYRGTAVGILGYLNAVCRVLSATWDVHGSMLADCYLKTDATPRACGRWDRRSGPPPEPTGGRAGFGFTRIPGIPPQLGSGYRFTSAEGSVAFDGTEATEREAIVFSYHYSNGPTRKVSLRVIGVAGKPNLAGSAKSVVFRIAVESSDLPGCTAGKPGTLRLSDRGLGDDEVVLAICGDTRSYALGQKPLGPKQPGKILITSLVVGITPQ